MPSPFGWGEIGLRDFEAFIYGATLLKPDVSHMETWPNVFFPGETYQPVAWDFSDLEKNTLGLLSDPKRRQSIAEAGQDLYRDTISAQGMERFCSWFTGQIDR